MRNFYSKLYSKGDAYVDKDEIIRSIETVTKIDKEDVKRLEREITEGEVSNTLKVTKNNVAPGPGGFRGCILQNVLEIFKNYCCGGHKGSV